jgi:hypothetical protein
VREEFVREAAARLGDRDAYEVLRDFMVESNVWTIENRKEGIT